MTQASHNHDQVSGMSPERSVRKVSGLNTPMMVCGVTVFRAAYTFPANSYTPWQFPCRVDGHSSRYWFEDEQQIRDFVDRLFGRLGQAPQRFRGVGVAGQRPATLRRLDQPG
jgi:hypothetical protein